MTDSPGQRMTKAQRRVLEAMARGVELRSTPLHWKIGGKVARSAMCDRLLLRGWVRVTPIEFLGPAGIERVCVLTPAGRAALAKETPRD